VVIVEEEDEDANIFAIGDQLLVITRPYLRRRRRARPRIPVNLHELELLDRNGLAVLEDFEVSLRESRNRLFLLVVDDHINAYEVDAATKYGRLLRLILRLTLGILVLPLISRRLRLLICGPVRVLLGGS